MFKKSSEIYICIYVTHFHETSRKSQFMKGLISAKVGKSIIGHFCIEKSLNKYILSVAFAKKYL